MTKTLYVAWRGGSAEQGVWLPIGRLDRTDGIYQFRYTRGATRPEYRPLPGMDDLQTVYESETLFPHFANRILSRSRPEYPAYLTWSGFAPDVRPDDLDLLGVTQGIRQTDNYQLFPCPTRSEDGRFLARFFLHGLRYATPEAIGKADRLRPDERLAMMPDIQNDYDPHAVAVRTTHDRDRVLLGYVPRYLSREIHRLCQDCGSEDLHLTVARANPGAPLQMRVLVQLRACWPQDFEPCSGPEFESLVPHAVPRQPVGA